MSTLTCYSESGYDASNPETMEMFLNGLAPLIAKDWRRLGRTLNVPEHEIEIINQDYNCDTKEKVYQTLLYWYRTFCKPGAITAAKSELVKALERINNKDVAQIISGQNKERKEGSTITENGETSRDYRDATQVTQSFQAIQAMDSHRNGYQDDLRSLQALGSQFSINLENILKELATCETKALPQKMENLQNLENMEKELVKMMGSYENKTQSHGCRSDQLEQLKKESRKRSEQTRQTMRFTNYLLEQRKNDVREHRTVSETLKRCPSVTELYTKLRRNTTFTEGTIEHETKKISRPIYVSKLQVEGCSSSDDNTRSLQVKSSVIHENDIDTERQHVYQSDRESYTTKL